jgi:Domain of unknown function (DUF4397)
MNLKHLGLRLATFFLLAGFIISISSCGGNGSRIRFVVADQTYNGNVDIVIDTHVENTNIAYGTGTAYRGISSGSHLLEVRPTGNTSSGSDFVNVNITVQGGADTTVILDFSGGSVATLFTDDNTQPSGIEIRPIHAASFFGPMDVYMIPQNTGIAGVSPQITNLAFNTTPKPNAYTALKEGSWEVVFTFAGTQDIIFDTGTSIPSLNAESIRTVVAINAVNGSPGYVTLNDLH